MGEGKRQMLQGRPCSPSAGDKIDDEDDDSYGITSSASSLEDSIVSNGSASSSTEMADDASSSTSYSSSLQSTGSLYDLSELMAQLPIKRGLSKFYQGKSQSFTLLSRVRSIEDIVKKETPYRRKMKACKRGGLDTYKSLTLPKPIISKKGPSRVSLLSSSFPSRRPGSLIGSCRPPLTPIQKNLI